MTGLALMLFSPWNAMVDKTVASCKSSLFCTTTFTHTKGGFTKGVSVLYPGQVKHPCTPAVIYPTQNTVCTPVVCPSTHPSTPVIPAQPMYPSCMYTSSVFPSCHIPGSEHSSQSPRLLSNSRSHASS